MLEISNFWYNPCMTEQTSSEIPFDSPLGLANAYKLPESYGQPLHAALYEIGEENDQAILQTRLEHTVLPISRLLSSLFSLLPEGTSAVQFVHPGCANKGADESWAAAIAALTNGRQTIPQVTSFGIDPNKYAIAESIEEAKRLHDLRLTDNLTYSFIADGAQNPDLVTMLDPHKPLVVMMRHPEHSIGREEDNRGFDYQPVFDTWARAVKEFTDRGIFALFVTTDPQPYDPEHPLRGDHGTSQTQMEQARAKVDTEDELTVLSLRNPSPTVRVQRQNDTSLTVLAPKRLESQLVAS